MNRTAAIIAAILLLGSAGWWGWTRSDLLPEAVAPETLPEAPPETVPEPGPEPEAVPAPTPPALPPAQPEAPVPTPPPVDAELPPETGSDMARETEAVAEAAISAADARARSEATARAERLAAETANAEIRQALAPFLNEAGFSAPAIRAALSSLQARDGTAENEGNALIDQARARLAQAVTAILDEAEAAEAAAPMPTGTAATGTAAEAPIGDTASAAPAAPFNPAPYISGSSSFFDDPDPSRVS